MNELNNRSLLAKEDLISRIRKFLALAKIVEAKAQVSGTISVTYSFFSEMAELSSASLHLLSLLLDEGFLSQKTNPHLEFRDVPGDPLGNLLQIRWRDPRTLIWDVGLANQLGDLADAVYSLPRKPEILVSFLAKQEGPQLENDDFSARATLPKTKKAKHHSYNAIKRIRSKRKRGSH